MAAFTLTQSEANPSIFLVVGPDGMPVPTINAFLLHLSQCGRSAYTLRSYARGLAHFFGWLHTTGQHVDEVTSQAVEAYIAFFSTEIKGGACPVDPHKAGQINLRTRKSAPSVHRQPRTINHQLSVLASFFAYCIQQDTQRGSGRWIHRANPVPASPTDHMNAHGMPGRDALRRGKTAELRRRVPRRLPRQVDARLAQQLIDTAASWRDKAILTLLYRTGQRIGDWSSFAGRHGILGMTLADINEQAGTITVFDGDIIEIARVISLPRLTRYFDKSSLHQFDEVRVAKARLLEKFRNVCDVLFPGFTFKNGFDPYPTQIGWTGIRWR